MDFLYWLFIFVATFVSPYNKFLTFFVIIGSILLLNNPDQKITKKAWGSLAVAVLFLLIIRQFSIAGPSLMLFGVILNVAVILANSGMPVPHDYYDAFKSYLGLEEIGYIKLGPATRLPYLSDILYVPGGYIISVGDIFILTGQGFVIIKYFLSFFI